MGNAGKDEGGGMTERVVIGDAVLYRGDCMDILPALGKVDAVITDPPYGIDGSSGAINKARAKGEYGNQFPDTPEYIRTIAANAIRRCIEISGCVVVTPGNRNFAMYPQPDSFGCFYQPAAAGLQVFGNLDSQPIFYYGKNASKKNMGVPCSYQLTEAAEKNGHPCAKPLKTWTRLLSNVTLEGQTVLDPFMGSGTTGVSALQSGRKFIGIELDPKYFDIACKRIEQAYAQGKLFEPEPIKQEQGALL
jgi:site-specific DNA-methyltransferase (adenine-specific)